MRWPRARALQGVWRGAVGDPIRTGRLRAVDWPYGLSSVVLVGLAGFVLAAVLALGSTWWRSGGELSVPNSLESSAPTALIWLLVLLLTLALSLLQAAVLRAPWWALTLGLLAVAIQFGMWGAAMGIAGGLVWGFLAAALGILIAVVFSLVRRRRSFAWWEFPVLLSVSGGVVIGGLYGLGGPSRDLEFAFAPVFLDQFVEVLRFLVLPAAVAAGAAVAEIAVGVTVAATRQAHRLGGRSWPYLLLGAVAVVRMIQAGVEVVGRDHVDLGPLVLVPAAAMVVAFGLVAAVLSRLARRSDTAGPAVSELPETLGRVGLPVAASLIGLQLPVIVLTFGFLIVGLVDPEHRLLRQDSFAPQVIVDRGLDWFRLLLALVLLGVAVRRARRGRVETALVLGCTAVVLAALSMRLLTGYRWAVRIDPDALNLVTTVVALLIAVTYLLRRRLTANRALGLAGLLVICALFSARDFISDPVGALLGYSGVALVLFGVIWDFLTGSAWANADSRRFPRPTRVLLVLTYSLLTVVIVAYTALVRKRFDYGGVDAYASLGDTLLGTALLAAAATAIVAGLRRDEPIG